LREIIVATTVTAIACHEGKNEEDDDPIRLTFSKVSMGRGLVNKSLIPETINHVKNKQAIDKTAAILPLFFPNRKKIIQIAIKPGILIKNNTLENKKSQKLLFKPILTRKKNS